MVEMDGACEHENVIDYSVLEDENTEVFEFLTTGNKSEKMEFDKIQIRKMTDPKEFQEYFNFPTKDPGLNDYTAVVIGVFVRNEGAEAFGDYVEFVNALRSIESNNFYLVENHQDIENVLEQQKKGVESEKQYQNKEVTTIHKNIRVL